MAILLVSVRVDEMIVYHGLPRLLEQICHFTIQLLNLPCKFRVFGPGVFFGGSS